MQFQLVPKLPARWCNKCASFIYGWIPLPAEAYNNKHPSHIFPSKPQNSRFHLYIPQSRGKAPGQPSVYLRIREAATTTWHQPSARPTKLGPRKLAFRCFPSVAPPLAPARPSQGAETTSTSQLSKQSRDFDGGNMPPDLFSLHPFPSCSDDFNIKVLQAFVELHEFADLNLVQALRWAGGLSAWTLTPGIRRDSPPPLIAGSSCGASVCQVKPRRSTAWWRRLPRGTASATPESFSRQVRPDPLLF